LTLQISDRAQQIQASATLEISATAQALRAAGKDVISLAAGEPDFDTDESIKRAAQDAISKGATRYTPVAGIPALRAGIAEKTNRERNLSFDQASVVVSCGAKQSLFNVLAALLNPGDEVIIPAPYWVSYPEMVKLNTGVPIVVPSGQSEAFKLSTKTLETALNSRTRALIINSPCNPTGAVYTAQELAALADLLRDWPKVMLISDDIYQQICFDEKVCPNWFDVSPKDLDRGVIIDGVSKAYAMTGWRIGWALGPVNFMQAISRIQGQSTSNPAAPSQWAALQAIQENQHMVATRRQTYQRRRDLMMQHLERLSIPCVKPEGAFYAFPNVGHLLRGLKMDNTKVFAKQLLEKFHVAVVPGEAFGAEHHLRFSFALSEERLTQAFDRLEKFLKQK